MGNQFLQKTNWVIITDGTSFIYEFLPKNQLVEQRGNHGRKNGLKAHFPKAQDFFFQQGRKAS